VRTLDWGGILILKELVKEPENQRPVE